MDEVSHALTDYLDRTGRDRTEFARAINVTRMALRRYEAGARRPEANVMDAIVKETGGDVTANAWLGKEAADVVAKRQARL